MKGYLEAEAVDSIISKFLEQSPISKENAREWMLFSRTVGTSLSMIDNRIKEVSQDLPARLVYSADHPKYPHVSVQLTGADGNAYAIIATVSRTMARGGVDVKEIDRFEEEAKAGNYEQLLQTCMAWVEVT